MMTATHGLSIYVNWKVGTLPMDDVLRIQREVAALLAQHVNAGVHPRLILHAVQALINRGIVDVDEDPVTGQRTTSIYRLTPGDKL